MDFRNSSATTISNKSNGNLGGLGKYSSKLMRDPDQIGSQFMKNNNFLGTNNSSSMFGNIMLNNSSANVGPANKQN